MSVPASTVITLEYILENTQAPYILKARDDPPSGEIFCAQYRFIQSAFDPNTFHFINNFLLSKFDHQQNILGYLFAALFSERLFSTPVDFRRALAPGPVKSRRKDFQYNLSKEILTATEAGFSEALLDAGFFQWECAERLTGVSLLVAVRGSTPLRWATRWLGCGVVFEAPVSRLQLHHTQPHVSSPIKTYLDRPEHPTGQLYYGTTPDWSTKMLQDQWATGYGELGGDLWSGCAVCFYDNKNYAVAYSLFLAPPRGYRDKTAEEVEESLAEQVAVLHMTPPELSLGYEALKQLALPLGTFEKDDPVQKWIADAFATRTEASLDKPNSFCPRRCPTWFPTPPLTTFQFKRFDLITGPLPINSIARSLVSTSSPVDHRTVLQWAFISRQGTKTLHICGRYFEGAFETQDHPAGRRLEDEGHHGAQ